jgi:hypothetical protein
MHHDGSFGARQDGGRLVSLHLAMELSIDDEPTPVANPCGACGWRDGTCDRIRAAWTRPARTVRRVDINLDFPWCDEGVGFHTLWTWTVLLEVLSRTGSLHGRCEKNGSFRGSPACGGDISRGSAVPSYPRGASSGKLVHRPRCHSVRGRTERLDAFYDPKYLSHNSHASIGIVP